MYVQYPNVWMRRKADLTGVTHGNAVGQRAVVFGLRGGTLSITMATIRAWAGAHTALGLLESHHRIIVHGIPVICARWAANHDTIYTSVTTHKSQWMAGR